MGIFDKLVKKDETNTDMYQINNEEKSIPVVQQTAATIDNPVPLSNQDSVFKVDPSDMLMGGNTKEDEITKLVSEVVQNEEKQAEEAVIELMSGSASDAIVMSTKVNENSENTISNDDSFDLESKVEENINSAPVEDIKSSEGFIPLEIINAQIANQTEVGDKVQSIKDEPEIEKVVIEFNSNKANIEPEKNETSPIENTIVEEAQPVIEQQVTEETSPIIELSIDNDTNIENKNDDNIVETTEEQNSNNYEKYSWVPDEFEQNVSWNPKFETEDANSYNYNESSIVQPNEQDNTTVETAINENTEIPAEIEEAKNEIPYSSVADFSLNFDYSEIEKAIQEMISSKPIPSNEQENNISNIEADEPTTFTIATIENPSFNLNPIPDISHPYDEKYEIASEKPNYKQQYNETKNSNIGTGYSIDVNKVEEEINKYLSKNKEENEIVPTIEAPIIDINPIPDIEYNYDLSIEDEDNSVAIETEPSFGAYNFEDTFASIEKELTKVTNEDEESSIELPNIEFNLIPDVEYNYDLSIEDEDDSSTTETEPSFGTYNFKDTFASIEKELTKEINKDEESSIELPNIEFNPIPDVEYNYDLSIEDEDNSIAIETEPSFGTYNFEDTFASIEKEVTKEINEETSIELPEVEDNKDVSTDNEKEIKPVVEESDFFFGTYNFEDDFTELEQKLSISTPESKTENDITVEEKNENNNENNYFESNEFDAFSWSPSNEPTFDYEITKYDSVESKLTNDSETPIINLDEETETEQENVVVDEKPIIEEEANEINIDFEEEKEIENPFANIKEEEINSVVLESTNTIEEVKKAKEEQDNNEEKAIDEIIPQAKVTSISEEIEEKAQALAEEKVQEILSHYKGSTEPTTDNDHAVAYISEAPDTRFCNHCGTTLTNDCHICPSCGEAVK